MSLSAGELRVTGRARVVNGQTEIPRPMFGVHATPLDPARVEKWGIESIRLINPNPDRPPTTVLPPNLPHVLECLWDRYQPALIVRYADWEPRLRQIASLAAKRALQAPRAHHIEFWNEPYLNWGTRPGVNYDGQFYRQEVREPGGRMTLSYANAPTEYLRWTEQLVAIHAEKGNIDHLATRFMPGGIKPGDTWTWRNIAYRAEIRPWGRDVTQQHFWPGQQNVLWYNQMLRVFAPAFKQAAPDIPLVAGWDFHIYQNSYAAWETVHKPTIDAVIEWIDGYTEHHYGGDTRLVAGSYETAAAYIVTTHNKFIRFYNTEAGGDLDPEQPGAAKAGYNHTPPEIRDRAAHTYFLRDVLHLLDVSPDKAAARAAHEAHHNKGVPAAFKLLRPLRGRLLQVESPQPDVWGVASLNDRNQLVLAVFNDTPGPLTLPLRVKAPAGTRFTAVTARRASDAMEIVESRVEFEGSEWTGTAGLSRRETGVWVFELGGTPNPAVVHEKQYFAPELLQELAEGGEAILRVRLPKDDLATAEAARLRIIQSGFTPQGHAVELNGHAVPLVPGGLGVAEVGIPIPWLQPENEIRIRRQVGTPAVRIDAGSIYLLRTTEP